MQGGDNGRDAFEEIILFFFRFDAVVEGSIDFGEGVSEGFLGALGDLIAHEDANLIHLGPFAVEVEECADLEMAGGDVEGAGESAPIAQVAGDRPLLGAVINDEKINGF